MLLDLGVETSARRPSPRCCGSWRALLVEQRAAGRRVVAVIDEAQNLSLEALEELRMLSNLETEKSKLIQIVLVGQPDLRDSLERPSLEQLRQRVTVRYHIGPLDRRRDRALHQPPPEARGDWRRRWSFRATSRTLVHARSGGVPRHDQRHLRRRPAVSATPRTRRVIDRGAGAEAIDGAGVVERAPARADSVAHAAAASRRRRRRTIASRRRTRAAPAASSASSAPRRPGVARSRSVPPAAAPAVADAAPAVRHAGVSRTADPPARMARAPCRPRPAVAVRAASPAVTAHPARRCASVPAARAGATPQRR